MSEISDLEASCWCEVAQQIVEEEPNGSTAPLATALLRLAQSLLAVREESRNASEMVVQLVGREKRLRSDLEECRRALSLANSMIKSGESHSAESKTTIDAALSRGKHRVPPRPPVDNPGPLERVGQGHPGSAWPVGDGDAL